MERRDFVRVMAVGGVSVLCAPSLLDCNGRHAKALQAWNEPDIVFQDIRFRLLSFAILAPNAHNKQPWIADLRGDGIGLYVDPDRLLPKTDPDARQIMISQGTFIETLAIAASHHGFRAEVVLFPDGVDPLHRIGTHPVARIALVPETGRQPDPLFGRIRSRHTNRRVYEGPLLTADECDVFSRSYADEKFPLMMIRDEELLPRVAGMMTEAMQVETDDTAMHGETVGMLRFDEDEVETYRDGIGLPNLGLTGLRGFFAGFFVKRSAALDRPFREKTVSVMREAAFSSKTIGVLSSPGTDHGDQVRAGRYFARIHLTAAQMGLSLHPMSQVLEIPSVKRRFTELLNLKDVEPQMVFRLGRSAATPHSPRRALADMMKT